MRNGIPMRVIKIVLGVVLLFWSIAPIYWGLVVSLSTASSIQSVPPPLFPHPFDFSFFKELLNGQSDVSVTFLHAFLNSVVESVLTTALTVVIAACAGYGFVRFKFRGSFTLFVIIIGTMSLPVYAVLIPLFQMITNMGLMDTYAAIVIINCSANLPLAIWLVKSHVASLPTEIEEAARIDGAGRIAMLVRVVIPLIAPGVASTLVIVFLSGWSTFLIPLIFAPTIKATTVTVLITQFATKYSVNYGLQAAAGILALVPPLVIVTWFNRHLIRGLLGGAVTS